MGPWARARQRRYHQVTEAAGARLDSGDQIRAVLGIAFNRWHTSATSIAISEKRVMFFTRDPFSGRLRTGDDAVATFPSDAVSLLEWTRNSRWSRLKVRRPDGDIDLRVDRVHREEAESLASLLPLSATA